MPHVAPFGDSVPKELTQTHSAHGVPPQPVQQGGRYEINPGPLVAGSDIGMSGVPAFSRIPCEAGTTNVLNPSMELQMATTAIPIKGGKRSKTRGKHVQGRRVRGGSQTFTPAPVSFASTSNFPTVSVGAADSMRYHAPTAGYRNDFEAFPAGGAVPGLTIQTPVDGRAGNLACSTTGGSRQRRSRHRGGNIFRSEPASYVSLSVDQVMNRSDFDGTTKGLPVKYGGRWTKKRQTKKHGVKRKGSRRGKYCLTGKIRRFFGL
jgi:hypothetical protein